MIDGVWIKVKTVHDIFISFACNKWIGR